MGETWVRLWFQVRKHAWQVLDPLAQNVSENNAGSVYLPALYN